MNGRQYRSTIWPGIYVLHSEGCPAMKNDRKPCACDARWRGRRRDPVTKAPKWGPPVDSKSAAMNWLELGEKAAPAVRERAAAGRTFGSLGVEWLAGVETGTIQRRRKGKPQPYSATTIKPYAADFKTALAEFHGRPASEIDEGEWQEFFDELRERGLSFSRAANIKAVASSIYAWASYRTRRKATGVTTNPLRDVDLGANTGRRRERVASADEARRLLAALDPKDQVPYGVGFYAGLRRIDIDRLDWTDVELIDGKPGYWLRVRPMEEGGPGKVGDGRRVPIAEPLRAILLAAFIRQGRPTSGRVCEVSLLSGKRATRVARAWEAAGLNPIGLHECRHTYCSFLVVAKYDLEKIMRYMGHTQLVTTQRYIHTIKETLPGHDEAEQLNAYFREREAQSG